MDDQVRNLFRNLGMLLLKISVISSDNDWRDNDDNPINQELEDLIGKDAKKFKIILEVK